jgi:hypothetical protein
VERVNPGASPGGSAKASLISRGGVDLVGGEGVRESQDEVTWGSGEAEAAYGVGGEEQSLQPSPGGVAGVDDRDGDLADHRCVG